MSRACTFHRIRDPRCPRCQVSAQEASVFWPPVRISALDDLTPAERRGPVVFRAEFDAGSCPHWHLSEETAEACVRRVERAVVRWKQRLPIADDLVELVGDLTRDGMGYNVLGVRAYPRRDAKRL